jgi:hypothetical protein
MAWQEGTPNISAETTHGDSEVHAKSVPNSRNSFLYKRRANRYLKVEPLTICIAAICNMRGRDTKLVLCADRQVTSLVQFEGTISKIKQITEYCYALPSSNDSRISDLILERVADKAKESGLTRIKDIVNLVVQESFNHKKEQIERDVLSLYNITIDSLRASHETLLERAIGEVENYPYTLRFDCIIAGLEPSGEAHIYRINQNGEYWCNDSIGYCTIGSGELNAFLELTKVVYDCGKRWESAVPLVYFAKKAAERASGVGTTTDLLVLHFPIPIDENSKPTIWNPLREREITKILDKAWNKMSETYFNKLNDTIERFIAFVDKARGDQKAEAQEQPEKSEPTELKS